MKAKTVFSLIVWFAFTLALAYASCSKQSEPNLQTASAKDEHFSSKTREMAANSRVLFREVQEQVGLKFLHRHGGTGEKYFIETMGAGCGILDFDSDGWQDIYLVQSGPVPRAGNRKSAANRLFRNQGDGTFIDVTEQSGAGDTGYGVGCCFGDFDNDGYVDIFVTNFGPNQLYRNNGDGTFTNVTEQVGVADERWATSAAFADYDRDGDLDLYVANFVTYSMENRIRCGPPEFREYCSPDNYPGCPDILYRNNGDGTFTDVTEESGVFNDHPDESKGLGVVWCDYDNDGDQDIYIANDSTPNFLYRNNGDGTFTDVALEAGAAYNNDGQTESSMGVDAGDYNWDGFLDIFLTHWQRETNTLYRYDPAGFFVDYTLRSNLGIPSLNMVGWGTKFFDYDNDGWLDIFVANGHTLEGAALLSPNSGITYAPIASRLKCRPLSLAPTQSRSCPTWFRKTTAS